MIQFLEITEILIDTELRQPQSFRRQVNSMEEAKTLLPNVLPLFACEVQAFLHICHNDENMPCELIKIDLPNA